MSRIVALALEVVGLSLLPGLVLVLLVSVLGQAWISFPRPFLDSEVLPWFLLSYGLPLAVLLGGGLAYAIQLRRTRRVEQSELWEALADR